MKDIFEKDELEIKKIKEKIKEKNADWLGRWLQKFSIEGDFWGKEKREKFKDFPVMPLKELVGKKEAEIIEKIKKENWL